MLVCSAESLETMRNLLGKLQALKLIAIVSAVQFETAEICSVIFLIAEFVLCLRQVLWGSNKNKFCCSFFWEAGRKYNWDITVHLYSNKSPTQEVMDVSVSVGNNLYTWQQNDLLLHLKQSCSQTLEETRFPNLVVVLNFSNCNQL